MYMLHFVILSCTSSWTIRLFQKPLACALKAPDTPPTPCTHQHAFGRPPLPLAACALYGRPLILILLIFLGGQVSSQKSPSSSILLRHWFGWALLGQHYWQVQYFGSFTEAVFSTELTLMVLAVWGNWKIAFGIPTELCYSKVLKQRLKHRY